jgi:GTP cyclohydrolase FolE2
MNAPQAPQAATPMEDVQGSADTRQLAINRVGIKAIRHPVKVQDKSGSVQHTIAMFNMYVSLPHNFKGTHMSRFVEILNSHEREISVENFPAMLAEMVERLEAASGHIEMSFPYFVNKTAPISGVQSLMDYDVTFIGDICCGTVSSTVKVAVPVTSLCPCSKKISGARQDEGQKYALQHLLTPFFSLPTGNSGRADTKKAPTAPFLCHKPEDQALVAAFDLDGSFSLIRADLPERSRR